MSQPARLLPHSIEAEQNLLASCFIDGRDVVARARDAGVTSESYYEPNHGGIWDAIGRVYDQGQAPELAVVAEELKSRGELDKVGGYSNLMAVSGRIPTTAQAGYFIAKVRELERLRLVIRSATALVEDCYGFSGDIGEIVAGVRDRLDRALTGGDAPSARGAMSFGLPPEDDPSSLLGDNRYISRGDGAIIVSSSGMGKSVLQIQWAVHCALGRPFFGITTQGKLTSLVIQSEDSDGDIGEVMFSLRHGLKLTREECEEVNRRVVFVRDKVNRGPAFINRLRSLADRVKPDLVWLNPLHAFAGCDIADATELGRFLRGGLNHSNREERFAYMIVHHTPKPLTGKGVADKKWHEFMYDAAGSAELVNWARAVLTLKPTETEGNFNLVLAKRGKRAGVRVEKPGAADGITRLELTTKVPLKHSTTMLAIEGRKNHFPAVCWESRPPDAPEEDGRPAPKDGGTRFNEVFNPRDLTVYYPAHDSEGHTFTAIQRFAGEGCGVSKATFARQQAKLTETGLVERVGPGLWRRTARGDAAAAELLASTP